METGKYIADIRDGDRDVFRMFMEENIDTLYRIVFRIVAREDEAQDLVQETFIKVWEKRRSLKTSNSLLNWAKRIAINRSYDYLRKIKRTGQFRSLNNDIVTANLLAADQADDVINNKDYYSTLTLLTNKLSPKQRLVFTLSEIEKMSHDEIEVLTGLTKNSVKSNLHHARVALKQLADKHLML